MRTLVAIGAAVLVLGLGAIGHADEVSSAESWKKQATETRAKVVAVAEELESLGAAPGSDAEGLIEDAKRWLAKGDAELAQADAQMETGQVAEASSTYNMAWQYYVKAATAGLNARRILTGR